MVAGSGHRWRLVAGAVAVLATSLPLAAKASNPSAKRRASSYTGFPYQKGMNVWSWTPQGYAAPAMGAALRRLKADGVDWVSLVPTWFQATTKSSQIGPQPNFTPSDAAVSAAVRAGHALGLSVAIKPLLNVSDGAWRGAISPVNRAAWWRAYDAFVRHYALLAEATGADELVIGTELAGMSSETSQWEGLVRDVRRVYRGYVTYAALPQEYASIDFWGALDAIGIDAYWKLSEVPTTSVPALRSAWQPILSRLQATQERWSKPVVFTEAAYASQVGTATDPSSWTLSSVPAPAQQAAAYSALLEAIAPEAWMRGVDWWAWRQNNETLATDFTPEGKPAETVLKEAWVTKPGATH